MIVPKNITILVDDHVNNLGLGDVEIVVFGSLTVVSGTKLSLSDSSSIEVQVRMVLIGKKSLRYRVQQGV